jgi:hypothetical protein
VHTIQVELVPGEDMLAIFLLFAAIEAAKDSQVVFTIHHAGSPWAETECLKLSKLAGMTIQARKKPSPR